MSSIVDRFNALVKGKKKTPQDFLANISSGGDFTRVEGINAILNSWNNILLTPLGSYLDDPTYGSELYSMIFEPADMDTQERIITEVRDRLTRVDDRASIINIDVIWKANQKAFDVTILVSYLGEEQELVVTISEGSYIKYM